MDIANFSGLSHHHILRYGLKRSLLFYRNDLSKNRTGFLFYKHRLTNSEASDIGAYIVSVWLVLIAFSLITGGKYFDVALRDLVMAVGSFALARLTNLLKSDIRVH